MPKVRSSTTHIPRLGDLTPDPQNANLGTARGREALAQSLREFGPGRAVLIDRYGNIIAGNKTVEEAKRLNIPLQVVKTDGNVLVAVQREDLDLITDPRAKRLAIADTAVIAAEKTGRVAYAMDLDPRYVQVALTPWEQFTGRRAQRLGRPTARRQS